MELKQVKALLHQTKCGEMFMDGMGCSEPVLTKDGTGLIDNFFVYLIDKRAGTASGPLARMGLHAESGALAYLTSADERPFSVLPGDTVPVNSPAVSNKDYENYSARSFCCNQIPVVVDSLKVNKQDYDDAMEILSWRDDNALLVGGSAQKERMNEVNTHLRWAKRV